MGSTLFGHWTDLHQRLAAPVAGLLTMALVYLTILEVGRNHVAAAAGALLFRAVPYGIAYSTWASDYAFAILFAAQFLYATAIFARTFSRGAFLHLTLVPAIAMHLNFLMGILWVVWAAVVVCVWWVHGGEGPPVARLFRPLRSAHFWKVYILGLALASPWYIRNTVLTGNPVYAFFPEIFTASVRVNPEVLESAKIEWFRHGDGVGKLAEVFHDLEAGLDRQESDPDYQRLATLGDRLRASFGFWVGFDVVYLRDEGGITIGPWAGRLAHLLRFTQDEAGASAYQSEAVRILRWPHYWKMSPLFPGLFFPLLFASPLLLVPAVRRGLGITPDPARDITFLAAGFLCFLLLAYMYFLADFYLYQCIPVLASAAVFSGLFFLGLENLGRARRLLVWPIGALLLVQAISPGLTFALLNFKAISPREIDGQFFNPMELVAFRNPGMNPELFYRITYGDDPKMWNHLNENLKEARLLTHENRHYVIDPSITLVHLDDWEIQKAWALEDPAEIHRFLLDRDIHWYLRIPKEANHPINRRLKMEKLEAAGLLELVYQVGGEGERTQLFRLKE